MRVRHAIAYCTDKAGLAGFRLPDLTPEQRQALIADTFIRPTSWAYTAPATTYPYAPATGQTLLDQAGWTLEPGATYRTRDGKQLVLTLRTTTVRLPYHVPYGLRGADAGLRHPRASVNTWTRTGSSADAIPASRCAISSCRTLRGSIPDNEPAAEPIRLR